MRIPGFGKARRAARWLKRNLVPSALVLLYHRVAEVTCDPQWLCVTPQHFAQHLEVLKKFGPTLAVHQLEKALRQERISRKTMAVTFDDGYADNLYNALPLLEQHGVPATFFLSSGYLGQEGEFWWDELERLILNPGVLPKTLRVTVDGGTHEWDLGPAEQYGEEAFARDRSWNAMLPQERTPRQKAYLSLCSLLRTLLPEQRSHVLEQLRNARGAAGAGGRPSHRALSPEEVKKLADSSLAEIGAHTVTHPVLAALPVDRQREEIGGSKSRIEEILGRPIHSFSYPFGMQGDYTSETVAIVRDSGFACACSNFEGAIDRETNPYQLPRFVVRDWDRDTFVRFLEEWSRG
ncbi:MAG: polysaccharide deacetylase family protein [Deltaproteobacteria bacterium]|nr:polysaccharide deacetylase family protein [Deltaproteobacteria bacterium]